MGKLYYDFFGTGFEKSFFSHLESLASNDFRPLIVIVPDNLVGISLQHKLTEKMGSLHNLRFWRFLDLSRWILKESFDLDDRPLFAAHAQKLLIAHLCSSLDKQHSFYSIKDQEGLAPSLATCFSQLTQARIHSLPPLSKKLQDLQNIKDSYEHTIARRFHSPDSLIEKAASSSKLRSQELPFSTLFVYGFSKLSKLEQSLISSIKNIDVHAWLVRDAMPSPAHLDSLDFFSTHCQADTHTKELMPSVCNVESLASPEDESHWIVRHILGLADQGQALHKIAVLYSPGSALPSFLQNHARRANLPFYVHGGAPFAHHPLGRGTLLLTELLGLGFTQQSWMEFFRHLPWKPTLDILQHRSQWQSWLKEFFWSSSKDFFSRSFEELENPQKEFFLFCKKVYLELQDMAQSLEHSYESFADALKQFWTHYCEDLEPSIAKSVDQCFQHWSRLDQLSLPSNFFERKKNVVDMLEALHYNEASFEEDGIFISSTDHCPNIIFDVIFVGGLNDGLYPSKPRFDPLLSRKDRISINEKISSFLTLPEDHITSQENFFSHLPFRAKASLHLSYSRLSLPDHAPMFASPFLHQNFLEKFSCKTTEHPIYERAHDICSSMDLLDAQQVHANFSHIHPEQHRKASAIETWADMRLSSAQWNEYDALLPILNKSRKVHSVSSLSSFLTCPMKYLLSYGFGLQSKTSPEQVEHVQAIDRGNILHLCLFEFLLELRLEKKLPLQKKDQKILLQRLHDKLNEKSQDLQQQSPVGFPSLWNTELRRMKALLSHWLDHEIAHQEHWIPWALEMSFGMLGTSSSDPEHSRSETFTKKLGSASLQCKGKIDRIDRSIDGKQFLLTDYKTGKSHEVRKALFSGGKHIQLPVYYEFCKTLFPEASAEHSGVQYMRIAPGSLPKAWPIEGEKIEKHQDQLDMLLSTASDYLSKGVFFPHPGKDGEHCRYCDFTSICTPQVTRHFERKKNDPLIQDYLALGDIE
ncbi:MAG: PD-(D/E)XK nuclease family protein [Bdellovibrionales bacterium]|nr:PD-(D/E)XK nuclease family protein [Bdellovibrionales bacterium]